MKFFIEYHESLASTNSLALDYLRQGRPEGTVIVAEFQTQGRGKPGRKWVSPPGENLLMTVLLKPPVRAHQAPLVTQIACQAVAEVLKSCCGLDPCHKRPNDLLVNGKKISGILVEASSTAGGVVEGIAVGIGLNVNAKARDLIPGATSIFEATGNIRDKKELLEKILEQISKGLKPLYDRPA